MTAIETLYTPVAEDIPAVADRLTRLADGRHPLLREALSHVLERQGKRIRPALVLLSGRLGGYERERLITLAAAIEVVHTATLVHDDLIDEASSRRGLETVNALWDGKVAILLGDYLFAQSAELATQLGSVRIMSLLSQTVMAMSSGELRQYAASRSRTIDEADYLQRITGKTASLFAMCCEGAAVISGQTEEQIRGMREYGLNLGLAFQIADDVLDIVGNEEELGKPTGSDLRQGTITLPVILRAHDGADSSDFRTDLERGADTDGLIRGVQESDAPERALARAEEYAARAREALGAFVSSPAKQALRALTFEVITRAS